MAKFAFIDWLIVFFEEHEGFLFDWDAGNNTKSEEKHGISIQEVESCFLDNRPLILGVQTYPENEEERYGLIAKSKSLNVIFICFTIREGYIRVISARNTNEKERGLYEENC